MDHRAALAFFKEVDEMLVERKATGSSYLTNDEPVYAYDLGGASRWVTMAKTALESVLPREHAILRQFESACRDGDPTEEHAFQEMRGVFRAARTMLETGRLASLADGIRAETATELLDQAEQLVAGGHTVAAAVLAGGALETHLRGLCAKHDLAWSGSGSISKYNSSIAQARNAGIEVYRATDAKSVLAWGGLRNDAAHDPVNFSSGTEGVRVMIHGIRDFIARTS